MKDRERLNLGMGGRNLGLGPGSEPQNIGKLQDDLIHWIKKEIY